MLKLIIILALPFLSGCAGTTFYDRQSGRKIADFRGNYIGSEYSDGTTKWKAAQVDHSTATLAGGQASSQIVNAITAGVTAAILAGGGGSGAVPIVTKLGGAAVPVIGHYFTSRQSIKPKILNK